MRESVYMLCFACLCLCMCEYVCVWVRVSSCLECHGRRILRVDLVRSIRYKWNANHAKEDKKIMGLRISITHIISNTMLLYLLLCYYSICMQYKAKQIDIKLKLLLWTRVLQAILQNLLYFSTIKVTFGSYNFNYYYR